MAKKQAPPSVLDRILAHAAANPTRTTGRCAVCSQPQEYVDAINECVRRGLRAKQIMNALHDIGLEAVTLERMRYHITAGHAKVKKA